MPKDSRRGGTYVIVLGVSLIVFVIGLGGLAVVNSQSQAADLGSDAAQARTFALSAIELARGRMAADASWRNKYSNGLWDDHVSIGSGKYSLSVANPNGPLNNADTDPVVVTGTGYKGDATQMFQVTILANKVVSTSLGVAVCAGSTASLNGVNLQASAVAASNGAMVAAGATVNTDVESAVSIGGGAYLGKKTAGTAARTLPGSDAFDYYLSQGRSIPITSLPTSSGASQLSRVLLSPAANPYGAANAQGIYVIDCQGRKIVISDSRIVGTLVLINVGAASNVQGSVRWAPAVANYPSLMVRGDFGIGLSSSSLSEFAGGPNVNFNPPGTPYPYSGGTTDNDTSDSYPSGIAGLVYISGNATTGGSTTVNVLVVGGTLTSTGSLTVNYDKTYNNNPPPGFYNIRMLTQPGGITQLAN